MFRLWLVGLVGCIALAGCSGNRKVKVNPDTGSDHAVEPTASAPPVTRPSTPLQGEFVWKGKHYKDWLVLLDDADPDERKKAADAMAFFGPKAKDAAPALGKRLVFKDKDGKDELSPVRLAAAQALVALGPEAKPAVAELAKTLEKDRDKNVRLQALKALANLGPEARPALPVIIAAIDDDKETDVRQQAVPALRVVDPSARDVLPTLIKTLHHTDRYPAAKAVEELVQVGVPAVPSLIEVLGDNDAVAVARAAETLGKIGPSAKSAVPALERTLKHKLPVVRVQSAQALKLFGADAQPAANALLEAINDEVSQVRAPAQDAIFNFPPDPEMVPRLIAMIKDKGNDPVRAARVLARIGKPAVGPLVALLSTIDSQVLVPSIFALGQIGPDASAAVFKLTKLLEDGDEDVQKEARTALKKIDPAKAAELGIK